MAKVYSVVEGLKKPKISSDWKSYEKECREYIDEIIELAKSNASCPEAGEEIRFPVADGYARYIVFSIKPLELIHLDIGDGWHFQYANRLTAKDV